MSNQVHNERIKLTATTLNILGVALLVGGAVQPLITGSWPSGGPYASLALIIGGLAFHLAAQIALRYMKG